MPVTRPALREHFALRRVQCGKQRRSPVASVIVGHALDVAKSHRQHRLRTFQRLNLALFIHAQNHSVFWRIQVQPYNIPYFLYEKWIGRELEMFLPVRLQPETPARCGAPSISTRASASAICRILQCVPSFGFVSSVLRTNCATRSSLIGRGRPWAQLIMQPGQSNTIATYLWDTLEPVCIRSYSSLCFSSGASGLPSTVN